MPDSRDKATRPEAQLPWESMDDGDTAAASAPAVAEAPAVEARRGEFVVVDDTGDEGDGVLDYASGSSAGAAGDFDSDLGYEHPVPAEPVEDDLGPPPRGGGWTVAALCAGIGLIACCVVIPQADANRRLVYERERMKIDLDSIRKQ